MEKYNTDSGKYKVESILTTSKDDQKKFSYFDKSVRCSIEEAICKPWKKVSLGAKNTILEFHYANPKSQIDSQLKRLTDKSSRRGT